MTDDHLMRMELTIELAAPPAVVWEAIATAKGLSTWFLETELEERVGGHVAFHMGPGMSSEGEITAWEPGERLAYSEPDWTDLAERENTGQSPLVSEFVIEAASGGTSVLKVVSSAYGTGAEWEREWFADMIAHWTPTFDTLKHYVERHGGEPGARFGLDLPVAGTTGVAFGRFLQHLGGAEVDATGEIAGTPATIERLSGDDGVSELLLRLDGPERGFAAVTVYGTGADTTVLALGGSLFGDDAEARAGAFADRLRSWLAPLEAA